MRDLAKADFSARTYPAVALACQRAERVMGMLLSIWPVPRIRDRCIVIDRRPIKRLLARRRPNDRPNDPSSFIQPSPTAALDVGLAVHPKQAIRLLTERHINTGASDGFPSQHERQEHDRGTHDLILQR